VTTYKEKLEAKLVRDAKAFAKTHSFFHSFFYKELYGDIFNDFKAASKPRDEMLLKMAEALNWCLDACKNTFEKEVPEGLAPMFYHTLTFKGDQLLREQYLECKKALVEFEAFLESK